MPRQLQNAAQPLVGLFSLAGDSAEAQGLQQTQNSIDGERLEQQVAWHRVWGHWPALASQLNTDDHDYGKLTRQSNLKKMQGLMQVKAIQEIHAALVDVSVEHLWLKGPLLSKRLYDDFTVRTSVDLDFIVDPNNVSAADQCLRGLGYVPIHIDNVAVSWSVIRFYLKDLSYRHPATGVCVELHWRWDIFPSMMPMLFDDAYSRCRRMQVGKHSLSVMGLEDELIYLCMHGSKSCWARLQWLLDIQALILQGDLDWKIIESRAAALGMLPDIVTAILLVEKVFEQSVDVDFIDVHRCSPVVQRNLSVCLQTWSACDYPPLQARLLHRLRMRQSLRHKVDFFMRRLISVDDALLLPESLQTPVTTTLLWPLLFCSRVLSRKPAVLSN
ncbi:Uncharacterised protein [BD1-7 clade bacterium]|uniref:Nucleotidyltransferase family protein n=1 Tax=BD1-7 clade bacterium TaxID=2029982 RepID=A0A5S9N2K0_9GAMM|nr:Uncharacterised protein [BD1-7 clade bacterium]CAA0082874.1 Uncharacterised protein [BD1-7 clade bacterium]